MNEKKYTVLLADVGEEQNIFLYRVQSQTCTGAIWKALRARYEDKTLGWTEKDKAEEPLSMDDYYVHGVLAGHHEWVTE